MKQVQAMALAAITLCFSGGIAVAQQQSDNRLKAVSVERYETGSGSFVPKDSTQYVWDAGEGAGSADFRNFPDAFWGWYFPKPIPVYNNPVDLIKSSQQISYSWNDTASRFDERYKTDLTLNANGLITGYVRYILDAGNWKQFQKINLTYQNGKLNLTESFASPDGINWENSGKYVFAYYASGDLKTYTTYQGLINNQWKPYRKKTFLYDNGLRIQETTVKWDDATNDWETHPYFRYDYTYNDNDLCDTATYSQWSLGSSSLEIMNRETYKYNINGFLTEHLLHDENNTMHIMRPSYKRDYRYNYSYPIESIGYQWNDGTNTFDNDTRHTFTFSGELLKRIDAETWNETSNSWEPEPDSWFGRKTTFYYEPIDEDSGTGIHVAQQMAFKIYPNPASKRITIAMKGNAIRSIQVVNLAGKTVYQNHQSLHTSSVTIPVSQLSPGIYYLKVQSGKATATKPFVVK